MAAVPVLLGNNLQSADVIDGGVRLKFMSPDNRVRVLTGSHVIAATGYKVNLSRLAFLSDKILSRLKTDGYAPVLSSEFESSVPGLYFVGATAMNSFGPVMRFVAGVKFASRRISRSLSYKLRKTD